jgi:hypothetical protein
VKGDINVNINLPSGDDRLLRQLANFIIALASTSLKVGDLNTTYTNDDGAVFLAIEIHLINESFDSKMLIQVMADTAFAPLNCDITD